MANSTVRRPPYIPEELFPGEWKWEFRYGIGVTFRKIEGASIPMDALIEYLETIHSCHRSVVERILCGISDHGSGSTTCGPYIHIDWLVRDSPKYGIAVSVGQPWCDGSPVPEGEDPFQ